KKKKPPQPYRAGVIVFSFFMPLWSLAKSNVLDETVFPRKLNMFMSAKRVYNSPEITIYR
ncbi:hypothetical protein, partial [Vibrio parahaemolyticus]|uniref:hypothetical protein n=1 Tax=Vibrio parahaemolyticus TaxID=670 RepID=UPI001E4DAEB5